MLLTWKGPEIASRATSTAGPFQIATEGTVPILQKRLATHLQALAAQVKNSEIVQLNTSLKPTLICVANTRTSFCFPDDAEHQKNYSVETKLQWGCYHWY